MRICSWNIAGLKDKLQDNSILQFVMTFDIVFLLEAKQYFSLTVPRFNVYANVSRVGQHRGGVVMLVKCKLTDDIINVDTGSEGQIWITMSWWPDQKIGGVYIPPSDSPYFSSTQHGTLASHTVNPDDVIARGDFT